jgi:hypothetical protein
MNDLAGEPRTGADWGRLLKIEDRIFTEHNLRFYGSGAVIAYALAAILVWSGLYRGGWVVRPDGSLANIDFCWIWVSGKFAVSSDPARIYDLSIYTAAQNIFYRPGACLFMHQFVYPPTLLFFTYILGLMPYFVAFAGWLMTNLVLYEAAIYAIIRRPAALIAALTPAAVLKNVQLGHNGFLTAGLIGLSLVFVERRPWLGCMFLGLLTYKPQFGVLFPLALLVSRNWRALASATAASLVFGIAAAVAFGHQGWASFVDTLMNRDSGLSPDAQIVLSLQSVYGLLHWAGASAWVSWATHLVVAAAVACTVWAAWAKPVPYALKAAILCIGSVMVTPYVLIYDLCVLSIAVAFLAKDGLASGFLPGERMVISVCFCCLFLVAVPVAPIICAALLFLAVRRIVAFGRDRVEDLPDVPVGCAFSSSRTR